MATPSPSAARGLLVAACGIWFPSLPEITLGCPALRAWSLSHLTTREVPQSRYLVISSLHLSFLLLTWTCKAHKGRPKVFQICKTAGFCQTGKPGSCLGHSLSICRLWAISNLWTQFSGFFFFNGMELEIGKKWKIGLGKKTFLILSKASLIWWSHLLQLWISRVHWVI